MRKQDHKCKVIAVANQKGGVGKTTTSVNLATALSKAENKVLIIDVDPQSNVAVAFGYDRNNYTTINIPLTQIKDSMKNCQEVSKDEIENVIIHHEKENVDLVLSDVNLSAIESQIIEVMGKESILSQYINLYRNDYDYIIIDCLPTLSVLTINALVACDGLVIPVEAQEYAIKGLNELLASIARTRMFLHSKVDILGILITKVDFRTNYNKDIANGIRVGYSDKINVFETVIPHSITAQESASAGESLHQYDPTGKVAQAYLNLAKEVAKYE